MRRLVMLAFALAGCRFNPTLAGDSLVNCTNDNDCPRGGRCVESLCIPQPLSIASLTATPEVVSPGAACAFEVRAVHAGRPSDLRYSWRRYLGPRVELLAAESHLDLTTLPNHIGEYAVEVTVENDIDPPVSGHVACTAIDETNAAFVVAGHAGDCSRNNPCGALSTALASQAQRIYLGADSGLSQVSSYWDYFGPSYDNREVHAGFVYPGWRRDREQVRMALQNSVDSLGFECSGCLFSGFWQQQIFDPDDYDRVVSVWNGDVRIEDSDVVLVGGGPTADAFALVVGAGARATVERVRVLIGSYGLVVDNLTGIAVGGDVNLIDSLVDLSAARANAKIGVLLEGQPPGPQVRIEQMRATTGGATRRATAMLVRCATATVWNSIFDARGDSLDETIGLDYGDDGNGCNDGAVYHSTLFRAGGGSLSRAFWLTQVTRSTSIINSILDAGDGFERRGIDVPANALDLANYYYDFDGTVVLFEGGLSARDSFATYSDNDIAQQDLETLLDCAGCLHEADTAAQIDRPGGNYHLTAGSSCCRDTGVPLDASAPTLDFDAVARPVEPARPSVGPYQYVP